jgi:hypothetical protein
MAKSDLLKEAIADAKAVKETALANAKIALQEAFAPRLERMLATKLTNEIEGEEEEMPAEEPIAAEPEMGDEMGAEAGAGNDVGDLSIDVDGDGEFDEFDIYSQDGEEEMPEEEPVMGDEEMTDEYNEGYEDDLNLESIIRELEGDLEGEMDPNLEDGMATEGDMMGMGHEEMPEEEDDFTSESIDEILEAILREEEEEMSKEEPKKSDVDEEKESMKEELEEAYSTVKKLQGILSEVNLLNAKLLYTNKLFRNFELSEPQKMKVIENFDRAGNTREVKLVFTTLAESFSRPTTKKRVVKESYASKPAASTAPSKETTQVLSEGFELANRWKKLAGLL